VTSPPRWPFRCPREGWYLSTVDAIFTEDVGVSLVDTATERAPLLVYGTCKQHGRVWLSSPSAYEPDLWRERT
jgi:hypothetical protein